jgi:hypothetical protein
MVGPSEIAREFAMSHSSASADLLLPFGSPAGVIPNDCVWQERAQKRVIGDFSSVIDRGWLVAESAAIPFVARSNLACTVFPASSDRAGAGGI